MDSPVPIRPLSCANSAPKRTGKVDAVIPYINQAGSWESLRYALRALEANFLDLGNVWLIGDCPAWIDRGKIHVQEKKIEYSSSIAVRNFNICNSMFLAAMNSDISQSFLYLSDDEYLLTPRTAEDFEKTILIRENLGRITQAQRERATLTEWQKLVWKTADKLKENGYQIFNYETHTPKLINRRKLVECFARLGYAGGLVWQTAYFNMFPPGAKGYLSERTPMKAAFYSPAEPDAIKSKADAAIFLSHNDQGLNEHLIEFISNRFANPSKFEL